MYTINILNFYSDSKKKKKKKAVLKKAKCIIAIFHSIPLSHRNEHFHPDPAWLNPKLLEFTALFKLIDKLKPLQY